MDADSEKVFFVLRLNRDVEERDLNISLLCSFQALGHDCPTQDQKEVITKILERARCVCCVAHRLRKVYVFCNSSLYL